MLENTRQISLLFLKTFSLEKKNPQKREKNIRSSLSRRETFRLISHLFSLFPRFVKRVYFFKRFRSARARVFSLSSFFLSFWFGGVVRAETVRPRERERERFKHHLYIQNQLPVVGGGGVGCWFE